MKESTIKLSSSELLASKQRRLDMQHLQAIEGNPLDAEQIAMFEMFDREGWSHERCLAYVLDRAISKAVDHSVNRS